MRVAVLLATYNGSLHIDTQIRSLKQNDTAFTLHWLDDHSTDDTRAIVRTSASRYNIDIREWHQPKHEGVPGAFFRLLECVDADIYLFCDQDDIWQPGKIDATVQNLTAQLDNPALCFSEPLVFTGDQPDVLRRLSDVLTYARLPEALRESRLFMSACVCSNTLGFTRALRQMVLTHMDVAREYARMHGAWLYVIAVATGDAHPLWNAPTTLYRRHASNFTNALLTPVGNRVLWQWRMQKPLRRRVARHARGFVLAAAGLPKSTKLDRIVALARVVETLDRKQSPFTIFRLARQRAMYPALTDSLWFAASCLWSDATAPEARSAARNAGGATLTG